MSLLHAKREAYSRVVIGAIVRMPINAVVVIGQQFKRSDISKSDSRSQIS